VGVRTEACRRRRGDRYRRTRRGAACLLVELCIQFFEGVGRTASALRKVARGLREQFVDEGSDDRVHGLPVAVQLVDEQFLRVGALASSRNAFIMNVVTVNRR